MKVVVAYKWAPNPQDASVNPDGTVDWSRARAAVSEYDPVAIEVGRRLADAAGAQLVGVTVGGPDVGSSMARKAALSRGLDTIHVMAHASLEGLATLPTAQALGAMISGWDDVAVVLTGDSSVDNGAKLVGPALAGLLGWPCLTDVTAVTWGDGTLEVERSWRGGGQSLTIAGPAVLACAPDAAPARIPGMKDIMMAAKKPTIEVPATSPGGPGTEVLGRAKPELRARKGRIFDGSDQAANATGLVEALRSAGVL